MSEKSVNVAIQQLIPQEITVSIKGITPLLMEKMSEDVVDAIDKKKSDKIVIKDRREESEKVGEKIHHTEDGNIGFPAAGFARGMVEVAPYLEGLDKKLVRGSIRVMGNIIPITYDEQTTNTTYGKQSGISKAPRRIIRPEFKGWSCKLNIRYNASTISAEQIVNLLNYAGFHMGIGAWRPACSGSYGQYRVVNDE